MATKTRKPQIAKHQPVPFLLQKDVVIDGQMYKRGETIYRIESDSKPGTTHTLVCRKGRLQCTCDGTQYTDHCRHVNRVEQFLQVYAEVEAERQARRETETQAAITAILAEVDEQEQQETPAALVTVGEAMTGAVEDMQAIIQQEAISGDKSYAEVLDGFYTVQGERVAQDIEVWKEQQRKDEERTAYLNWELSMGL